MTLPGVLHLGRPANRHLPWRLGHPPSTGTCAGNCGSGRPCPGCSSVTRGALRHGDSPGGPGRHGETPAPGCGWPPCPRADGGVASAAISIVMLLLGPLEVRDASTPVPLGGRKPRALLARLALDANRTVPVDRLIEDLWGEDAPDTAAKMVQIHVSQLRKALPAGLLVTRPGGYVLVAEPEAIDLVRFERLRAAGRAALAGGDPRAAADVLGEALALWRGEALAEFGEPFAGYEGARLAELRLTCAEDRIEAELALGCPAAVTAELEALVAREPLRERPRAQLMLALYRGGRHADALATFHDLRRTLDEELGLVPSAALGELE